MTPKLVNHPADLARLIPTHVRRLVKDGHPPMFRVNKPDYDRLALDTFLVRTEMGTDGRVPTVLMRIVKPNDPTSYPPIKLTADKRLLYACWANGQAIRQLAEPRTEIYRHVVLPCDPRHEMVAAFKLACDMRHAAVGRSPFKPDLLLHALGIEQVTQ